MNKLVREWLDAREVTAKALENERLKEVAAARAEIPSNLRPANERDIVVGAILWYPDYREDDEEYPVAGWNMVDEVLRPRDEFKAYCSHDGCRYGLHGAFVELDA